MLLDKLHLTFIASGNLIVPLTVVDGTTTDNV
jgi:hypothetical protein